MKKEADIFVFQIGTMYFGLEVDNVKGIVTKVQITGTNGEISVDIVGMININQEFIPVLDLYREFTKEALQLSGDTIFVLVGLGKASLAIPVDRTETLYRVPGENFTPVPCILRGLSEKYIGRIADIEGRLVSVIDCDSLFHGYNSQIQSVLQN